MDQVTELCEHLMTVNEVAERLRLGRTVVYALLGSGELRSIRFGRARRVRPADLAAFIASQEWAT